MSKLTGLPVICRCTSVALVFGVGAILASWAASFLILSSNVFVMPDTVHGNLTVCKPTVHTER